MRVFPCLLAVAAIAACTEPTAVATSGVENNVLSSALSGNPPPPPVTGTGGGGGVGEADGAWQVALSGLDLRWLRSPGGTSGWIAFSGRGAIATDRSIETTPNARITFANAAATGTGTITVTRFSSTGEVLGIEVFRLETAEGYLLPTSPTRYEFTVEVDSWQHGVWSTESMSVAGTLGS
jgi:hypothetical protein